MDQSLLAALAAGAAAVSDQTKTVAGGGDYTPPAEGACKLRLVGYIELGKHEKTFKGVKKLQDMVRLEFEVSGPKHPPIEVDGVKKPIIVSIEENLSLNEKARFAKLFARMNYAGKYTHASQMVLATEAFKARIVHRKYAKSGEAKDDATKWTGVAVELYDKKTEAFTIEPPRIPERDAEGLETGNFTPMAVEPALTSPRLFIWNADDKHQLAQWSTLFIDGEYEERKDASGKVTAPKKSKNVLQNRIKLAKNFQGSALQLALLASGATIDIPDAEAGRDDTPPGDDDDNPDGTASNAKAAAPTGAAATAALNDALAGVA